MIGRANIEGSKSNVAMNAWLPQASYPCGNFSGTSSLKFRGTKELIGHTFMVCIHTENQNQGDFYPFVPLKISVLNESPLGHLYYLLTDVLPQPSMSSNWIGLLRTLMQRGEAVNRREMYYFKVMKLKMIQWSLMKPQEVII